MSSTGLAHELAPETYAEAANMLREAAEGNGGLRIRGGGTKLGWGRPTPDVDHELSTKHLDQVLEHNEGDFTAIVQAGVRLRDLQRELRSKGQRLSLDPPAGESDGATIGGIAATADAGPLRHRYGAPRDLILGVTVALPDGTLAKSGGKVIKNVAGYDLGKLYAGSFGTLGLILQVALRLHPLPEETVTAVGCSDDPDLVAQAALALSQAPLEPEALDVRWTDGTGTVLIRLAGGAAGRLAERARSLLADVGLEAEIATDGAGRWKAQREGQRAAGGAVVRVSGTMSRLADVLKAARERGASLVGRAAFGVSWLALEPAADSAFAENVDGLRRQLSPSPCVVLDASESFRDRFDVWGLDAGPEQRLMKAVKDRFDPEHRCNPGLFGASI